VGLPLTSTKGATKIQEKKMSKIYKSAVAAAMAVSATTFLVITAPASAAPQRSAVDYCLSYDYGGTDCSFVSKAQCQATASGIGAECYRNDFGKAGETLQW
jgi:uncharacterized protein DUF3551